MQVYEVLARRIYGLEQKLIRAGMSDRKVDFVRRLVLLSIYASLGIVLFLFFVLAKTSIGENTLKFVLFLFAAFLVMLVIFFNYFLHLPDMIIARKSREISKEIVYVGRFMIIELNSGVPLYKAMKNIAVNFPATGKYFKDITNRIDLGGNMEDAIVQTIEISPSNDLSRILWQVLNSSKTGSDIKASLHAVLEQITREQQILVKDYGRKLNPLAMFYMMIAVIIPSLGTTMLTVLASFLGLELSLTMLLLIAFAFGFIQFMFIAMMKSTRPPVDM